MASAKKALVTTHENIMWLHKYSVYTGSALVGVALMFAVTANAAPQPDVTNAQLYTTLQSISTKLTSLESSVRQQCRPAAPTNLSTGTSGGTSTTPSSPVMCDIGVVTNLNTGSGSMSSENPIGTFVFADNGQRAMTIKKISFEVYGAYDATNGYGPKNFRLDRADPVTGARVRNSFFSNATLAGPKLESGSCPNNPNCVVGMMLPVGGVPASGSVLSFDILGAGQTEEVGAGSRKAYTIIADTTNVKNLNGNNSATTTVRMKSMTAGGMENAVSCDASKTMLVEGKMLTY